MTIYYVKEILYYPNKVEYRWKACEGIQNARKEVVSKYNKPWKEKIDRISVTVEIDPAVYFATGDHKMGEVIRDIANKGNTGFLWIPRKGNTSILRKDGTTRQIKETKKKDEPHPFGL